MLVVSQSFVASLAQALNSAQVPCILWGDVLLCLHGVPAMLESIDFVIPHDCLEAGAGALAQCNGLVPCPDPLTCPVTSKKRLTQPPASHVHLEDRSQLTAGLYVQSDTLWVLPPLDRSLLSPSKDSLPSYFALASDQTVFPPQRPGRGIGVFPSAAAAVIAPRAHILLEAYMRLYARDAGKRVGTYGAALLAHMEGYVEADGLLDANLIPEPLRTFYREVKEGKKPMRQWTRELKEALGVAEEKPESDDDY